MSNRQERRKRRERHLFLSDDGHHVLIEALGTPVDVTGQQLDKVLAGHQLDDAPEGAHVWAMFAVFRCAHPERAHLEQQHMDSESLLMVTGPGCYRCEQIYSPGAERTRCPGEPT